MLFEEFFIFLFPQLLQRKSTFKFLFMQSRPRITVQKIVQLLKSTFSKAGSNRRTAEERVYGLFVRYIRQVAGNAVLFRILEHLLKFCRVNYIILLL